VTDERLIELLFGLSATAPTAEERTACVVAVRIIKRKKEVKTELKDLAKVLLEAAGSL
jgi:hypothetical protein